MTSPVGNQLHQPRLAELVAADLRRRILDGELADGALLPNLERLLAEFATDGSRTVDASVIRDHARRPGLYQGRDGS